MDLGPDEGELIDGVLGTFAAFERKRIARRTRTGNNQRVRQGGWGGGEPPFGYCIVGSNSEAHLEVEQREAQVVINAVNMILDHGLSTLQAAERLNSLGLTPRNAPLWTSQNLRNCLMRGQWGGIWTFGKTSPKGSVPEPIEVPVEAILTAERAEVLRRHLQVTRIQRGAKGVHPALRAALVPLRTTDDGHRPWGPSEPPLPLPSRSQDAWTPVLQLPKSAR